MRKGWAFLLALGMLAAPRAGLAQAVNDAAEAQNAERARTALNAMVQALGGQAWLDMKNEVRQEHVAAFFHGQPDLGTTEIWDYHAWPDRDRVEVTKHRDVVEFYVGREGWEVTYRGKKAMQKDLLDDFLRRRDHSIETAVKVWLKDPKTILIYEGQHMVERKLGEQVTLISPQNEAITILMDTQTHLPLERSFEWRDPEYHDKNTDVEEYDDYHTIDGFPTAFSITRLKNDETTRQYYVDHVEYNRQLSPDFWNVDAAAKRIKH
ncbi:MAG TPA: hypothetical protein VKR52_08660 [Terracidiphilus sp.]|nr:hypothetical protein [Terracidiphilus sp.]